MYQSLTSRVDQILRNVFAALNLPISAARVNLSLRPEHADFQCNGCLSTAKLLGRRPFEIATEVADLLGCHPEFSNVSAAEPGFVNIRLSHDFLTKSAEDMAKHKNLGIADEGRGRLAIIDYGGPNVAKPLHVGHLRSLLIGESLRRILIAQGWRVISDAHLGDWGLQMGMLTSAIRMRHPNSPWFTSDFARPWPDKAPVTLSELEKLYPEAAEACRGDPGRMAEARADTAALQAGNPGLTALWRCLRELSLEAQQADFISLGIQFDLLLGESDAHPLIAPMVDDLKARGIANESDGALIVDVGEPEDKKNIPPLLLAKSDGSALYSTTDLATLADRVVRMKADRIIYVVDQRQSLHFEQLFRAAAKAGYSDGVELRHVGFGTVNGSDGKPYKTRQGGVARLSDLIAEAVAKAATRIAESGYSDDLPTDSKDDLARKVGIAAVKFADLSGDRLSGYVFDVEKLVSFEGRTGPYLQYAGVRISSLLAKAAQSNELLGPLKPSLRTERNLILICLRFPDAVAEAARLLQPGVLAEYAFGLAQSFSRFYADFPVLGGDAADERASRLEMCKITGLILERCLDLLGIDVPEKM